MNSWFGQVLISLDQLGNALTGGYADTTISARLGYAKDKHWVFASLARLVDLAFAPVEPAHTYWAWRGTRDGHGNARRGNDVAMVLLVLVTLPFLVPIWLVNVTRMIVGYLR